MTESNRTAS